MTTWSCFNIATSTSVVTTKSRYAVPRNRRCQRGRRNSISASSSCLVFCTNVTRLALVRSFASGSVSARSAVTPARLLYCFAAAAVEYAVVVPFVHRLGDLKKLVASRVVFCYSRCPRPVSSSRVVLPSRLRGCRHLQRCVLCFDSGDEEHSLPFSSSFIPLCH